MVLKIKFNWFRCRFIFPFWNPFYLFFGLPLPLPLGPSGILSLFNIRPLLYIKAWYLKIFCNINNYNNINFTDLLRESWKKNKIQLSLHLLIHFFHPFPFFTAGCLVSFWSIPNPVVPWSASTRRLHQLLTRPSFAEENFQFCLLYFTCKLYTA